MRRRSAGRGAENLPDIKPCSPPVNEYYKRGGNHCLSLGIEKVDGGVLKTLDPL